jgi:DNA-binding transcriptional LysR family regulator
MHAVRDGGSLLRGRLHLSAPMDLGSSGTLAELLAAFRVRHPEVDLLVGLDDRQVDLTSEGVDFAFRIHTGPVPGHATLRVRRLATVRAGLYASPAYLERFGRPESVDALLQHALITPTFALPWQLHRSNPQVSRTLEVQPSVLSSSLNFMEPAARAQMGIAPIPNFFAAPAVHRGELVRVLTDWHLMDATLSLLWPASRLPSPRRRAFLDFVVAHAEGWKEL